MIDVEVENLDKQDVADLHALEGSRNDHLFQIGEHSFEAGSIRFNRLCAGLEYGRGYCGHLEFEVVNQEMLDLIDFDELPGIYPPSEEDTDGDIYPALDA